MHKRLVEPCALTANQSLFLIRSDLKCYVVFGGLFLGSDLRHRGFLNRPTYFGSRSGLSGFRLCLSLTSLTLSKR